MLLGADPGLLLIKVFTGDQALLFHGPFSIYGYFLWMGYVLGAGAGALRKRSSAFLI